MKKLLALFLFAACGSDPSATLDVDAGVDPTDDATVPGGGGSYESGSRIKLRTLRTSDGARHYVGWRDTLYNDDCEFRKAADGAMRCLPLDAALHIKTYADSACSIPAVVLFNCNPTPKYIQELITTPGCASTQVTTYGKVWLLGPQTATVYAMNGSCDPVNLDVTTTAYRVGTEIPLDNFQSATIGIDP